MFKAFLVVAIEIVTLVEDIFLVWDSLGSFDVNSNYSDDIFEMIFFFAQFDFFATDRHRI